LQQNPFLEALKLSGNVVLIKRPMTAVYFIGTGYHRTLLW